MDFVGFEVGRYEFEPTDQYGLASLELANNYYASLEMGAKAGMDYAEILLQGASSEINAFARQAMLKEITYAKNLYIAQQTAKNEHYNATHDLLTGIFNRRGLDEHVASLPNLKDKGVFVVDATNFKAVNDKISYGRGDEVLKAIANLLEKSVRDNDVVARTGGDEFVVVVDIASQEDTAGSHDSRRHILSSDESMAGFVARSSKFMQEFLEENSDVANCGVDLSVGGVLCDINEHFESAKVRAEKEMKLIKSAQHDSLGQHRIS